MKKLLLLSFLTITFVSNAQKYGTSAGIRLANDRDTRLAGFSIQQRIFEHTTIEGVLQSDFLRNTTAHLLVKQHHPILSKRLNLYTGVGLSAGIEESYRERKLSKEVVTTYGNETIGVDLVTGVEVALLGVNISLDYKPNFNLIGKNEWYQGQIGLSLRKILITHRQQKKKKRKRERKKRK